MAVTLTESAVARVREINAKDGSKPWLRLAVRGGGCSGLSYFLDFVEVPLEGDKSYELHGGDVKVCVDKKSYLFLNGTEIDFERGLLKTGFVFKNPLAVRSCSCGESFTI